jgi:hypothetical protein
MPVTNIYEREEKRHVSGVGAEAVMETFTEGWVIVLGNNLGLIVSEKPADLKIGDHVELTADKIKLIIKPSETINGTALD